MEKSKLSWYISENGMFMPKETHNAGMFYNNEVITFSFQTWNNRWGEKEVAEISDAVLNMSFDAFEDSSLLELCKVSLKAADGKYDVITPTVSGNTASAKLNRTISGKPNDGDETELINFDNFVDIIVEIDIRGQKVKSNDLKSLYFEIVEFN